VNNRRVNLNRSSVLLSLAVVFLILLSTGLYLENQGLEQRVSNLKLDLHDRNSKIDDLVSLQMENNASLKNLSSRADELTSINKRLRKQAEQYIVTAQLENVKDKSIIVSVTNYGDQEAQDVKGVCEGGEAEADRYHSFEFTIDNLESNTQENININPEINYPIQNLENVQCSIEECSGNCVSGTDSLNS